MINIGDLHYAGIVSSVKKDFLNAYHEVFKSPVQRSLYESFPLVYTFDDHDVGKNNADGLSSSSKYVNEAYRVIVEEINNIGSCTSLPTAK